MFLSILKELIIFVGTYFHGKIGVFIYLFIFCGFSQFCFKLIVIDGQKKF